jgi:hypothetical protein
MGDCKVEGSNGEAERGFVVPVEGSVLQVVEERAATEVPKARLIAEEWGHEFEEWAERFPEAPLISDEALRRDSRWRINP